MFQASTRTVDFHNIIFLILYDFVIIIENRRYSARTPLPSWTIWHEFVVIFHNQKQIRRVCVRFVNTMAVWVVKFSREGYIYIKLDRFLAKNQHTPKNFVFCQKTYWPGDKRAKILLYKSILSVQNYPNLSNEMNLGAHFCY